MRRSVIASLALTLVSLATVPASAQSADAELAARYRHGSSPHPFLDALARGRLERHPTPPKQEHGYRAAVVPVGWALTGDELAPFNVSDTDAGRQEVAAFVARLRARGSAPQRWVDWDPKADTKSNCEKTTVSVTVEGVGLSHDAERCERWDIDKKAGPADFANRWRGGAVRSERSTAAVTATQVDNGATPRYLFEFDYYAKPE